MMFFSIFCYLFWNFLMSWRQLGVILAPCWINFEHFSPFLAQILKNMAQILKNRAHCYFAPPQGASKVPPFLDPFLRLWRPRRPKSA